MLTKSTVFGKEKTVKFYINTRILGYKVHYTRGAVAYEAQLGTLVVQWFYAKPTTYKKHLRVWHDPYGSRKDYS